MLSVITVSLAKDRERSLAIESPWYHRCALFKLWECFIKFQNSIPEGFICLHHSTGSIYKYSHRLFPVIFTLLQFSFLQSLSLMLQVHRRLTPRQAQKIFPYPQGPIKTLPAWGLSTPSTPPDLAFHPWHTTPVLNENTQERQSETQAPPPHTHTHTHTASGFAFTTGNDQADHQG